MPFKNIIKYVKIILNGMSDNSSVWGLCGSESTTCCFCWLLFLMPSFLLCFVIVTMSSYIRILPLGNFWDCVGGRFLQRNVAVGTTISLRKSNGKEIASITTTKVTETFQFAGKGLKKGGTYTLYCDDEEICTITLTGKVTTVDDSGTETSVSGMMMGGGHVRSWSNLVETE